MKGRLAMAAILFSDGLLIGGAIGLILAVVRQDWSLVVRTPLDGVIIAAIVCLTASITLRETLVSRLNSGSQRSQSWRQSLFDYDDDDLIIGRTVLLVLPAVLGAAISEGGLAGHVAGGVAGVLIFNIPLVIVGKYLEWALYATAVAVIAAWPFVALAGYHVGFINPD